MIFKGSSFANLYLITLKRRQQNLSSLRDHKFKTHLENKPAFMHSSTQFILDLVRRHGVVRLPSGRARPQDCEDGDRRGTILRLAGKEVRPRLSGRRPLQGLRPIQAGGYRLLAVEG